MAEEGFKHKITAILSADVVGYGLLVKDNSEATIWILNACRDSISMFIQQYNGRSLEHSRDILISELCCL